MNLDRIESFPREEVLLAYLASVPAGLFSIVQIQRGIFLISKNLPDVFETPYDFNADSYGPRCSAIPGNLDILMDRKFVKLMVDPASYTNARDYLATPNGLKHAETVLSEMSPKHRDYFKRVAEWILQLSFIDLTRSMNQAYPEMVVR